MPGRRRSAMLESSRCDDRSLVSAGNGGHFRHSPLLGLRDGGSGRHGRLSPIDIDGGTVWTPLKNGAAKLSGKTRRGWSLGVLEAVTGRFQPGLTASRQVPAAGDDDE